MCAANLCHVHPPNTCAHSPQYESTKAASTAAVANMMATPAIAFRDCGFSCEISSFSAPEIRSRSTLSAGLFLFPFESSDTIGWAGVFLPEALTSSSSSSSSSIVSSDFGEGDNNDAGGFVDEGLSARFDALLRGGDGESPLTGSTLSAGFLPLLFLHWESSVTFASTAVFSPDALTSSSIVSSDFGEGDDNDARGFVDKGLSARFDSQPRGCDGGSPTRRYFAMEE
mmetsp:Transcript_5615/g.11138  ORF Transcript_5615/g.11138 Transcript_5615/m.11138 type:complete len:227 (+) Transcript_5615:199-879(+)